MSALPEKMALRRALQNFAHRLNETINELMLVDIDDEDSTDAVQFRRDNIIAWLDQHHVFCPSTYTLLKQFFEAPNRMLSKEDIRQDVMGDDEAREGSIRQCILEARKELRRSGFPYSIETIRGKGYRLVAEQNLSKE